MLPSFDHHGLLGVASVRGEEYRGKTSSGWIKAFLASDNSIAVLEIDNDPLTPVVSRLPLLHKSQSIFLDGVGYQLRIETNQINSNLSFGNPTLPELVALERTAWELAETIARRSRNKPLASFVNTWRRYHERGEE